MKIGVQIAKEYADDADAFSKKIYDVIGSGVGIIESVPAQFPLHIIHRIRMNAA